MAILVLLEILVGTLWEINLGKNDLWVFLNHVVVFRSFITGETTVKPVTYTDWQTRNGPVTKSVLLLVTPKVKVRLKKGLDVYPKWMLYFNGKLILQFRF